MSEPTLQLSEHELFFAAPDVAATAPATRVEGAIDGRKIDFLVRLEPFEIGIERADSYATFYRPAEENDAPVLASLWKTASPRKAAPLKATLAQSWRKNSANSQRPARLWRAPDAAFGLALTPDGIAEIIWHARNGKAVESLTFRWRPILADAPDDPLQQINLRNWPQSEMCAFCQSLYDDADSQLNRALRWQLLSTAEKDEIAFACQIGDWEQLRHLSLLALRVVTHYEGLFPFPQQGHSYRQLDYFYEPSGLNPRDDAVRWMNELLGAIYRVMRPTFWPDEPLFIYAWRGEYPQRRQLTCDLPSQHQFLEARLELRDWLRAHLPETEIEKLLLPSTNQL